MNQFNVVLAIIALILAVGLIYSTYVTKSSFYAVFSVTDAYLSSQQTTGMLDSLSSSMSQECRAFLQDSDPSHAHTFNGQRNALNEQLAATENVRKNNSNSDAVLHLDKALNDFWTMSQTELYAMRLKAETMKVPMAAYPELIQQVVLTDEDLALSPEEKLKKAEELITSETFLATRTDMENEIDINHRLLSEDSKAKEAENEKIVRNAIRLQKIVIFLFLLLAFIALLVNRLQMIRPIQKSIALLDQQESLPVEGSYEFRHLAIAYNKLLDDNREKQQALSYTAEHDALTGVLNRTAFESAYSAFCEARKGGLMILDIDHFKYFNDQFGHDIGDRVLTTVTQTIRKHFREEDPLFRIGGDEFVILMENASLSNAEILRDKLYAINQDLSVGSNEVPPISLSAGLAFFEQLSEGKDLFKCADIALLYIKEHGRLACGVYQENADVG